MSRAIASFCGSGAALLTGIAVPIAFPDAPRWVGLLGLALSLALLLVGACFAFRSHRAKRKSPIVVARYLFVDRVPATDVLGVAKTPVEAVFLHLQVSNRARDGRTIRNVRASLENEFGDRAPLLWREGLGYVDRIDLRGRVELLEIGFVAIIPPSQGFRAITRLGQWRRQLSHAQMESAFQEGIEHRSLYVGGDGKLGFRHRTRMRIIITADDAVEFSVVLETDFSTGDPYTWLKRVRPK